MLAGRARFKQDGDSWQVSLYHEVDYLDFQNRLQKQGLLPAHGGRVGLPVRRRVSDPVPMGRWVRLLHASALV